VFACFDLGQSVSTASKPTMKLSRAGVELIKSFEGLRSRAVLANDGRWVVGYGHRASAREGAEVSEQEAELLLQYDLLPVVAGVNEGVKGPVNQHQFDALASFAVSVGVEAFHSSDVLRRFNDGQMREAADALIGWAEPAAPDAAPRRRSAERALLQADPSRPVSVAELMRAPVMTPAALAAVNAAVAADPMQAAAEQAAAARLAAAEAEASVAAPVLRHETRPAPKKGFDWNHTGAFMIMGAIGFIAIGGAAAAFRLAANRASPSNETFVIAGVLGLIGAVCVAAAFWNLYGRRSKTR
jgi:lysozyme